MIGRVLCHAKGHSSRTEETIRELLRFWIGTRAGHSHCADSPQRFYHKIRKTEIGGVAVEGIATPAPPTPLFMRNGRCPQSLFMVRRDQTGVNYSGCGKIFGRKGRGICMMGARKYAALHGVLVFMRRTKEASNIYQGNGEFIRQTEQM